MIAQILQFIPFIMQLLKGAGIIKDPEQEKELRLKLLEYASREREAASEEFAAFIKATTPESQYVWPWVNSMTTLMRPSITAVIVGTIVASIWIPGLAQRAVITLEAFSKAGTAGLLFLAIPLWWFFGRSAEKIVPALSAIRAAGENGNGKVLEAVVIEPEKPRLEIRGIKPNQAVPERESPGLGG